MRVVARKSAPCTGALALGAVLLLWLAPGCAPKERQLVSNGFRYVAREDDAIEPELLTHMGEHRRAIERYLRLDPQAVGEVSYHKFRDPKDLHKRGHCSPASAACYYRKWGVEASTAFERHELIHAYVAHWGDSHRLLEEGLADALSCDEYLPQKVDVTVEDAFSRRAWLSLDEAYVKRLYAAGARFTASLVRHYGPDRFREFYARTLPSYEYEQAQAAFADVFGANLADAWQRAHQTDVVDAACLRAFECSLPDVGNVGETQADATFTLTVKPGELLQFVNDERRPWKLGACDEHLVLPYEGERLRASGQLRGQAQWLALAAGKYWVELGASRLTRLPLYQHVVDPAQCKNAVPLDVGDQGEVFFALDASVAPVDTAPVHLAEVRKPGGAATDLPVSLNALALRLRVGSSASLPVTMECSDTARVELCTACDYMQCQVACGQGSAPSLLMSEGAVLKVTTPRNAGNLWFRLRKAKAHASDRGE